MICDTCSFKRQPWSKDLAAEGYTGCGLLLSKPMTETDYVAGVGAEIVAFGWITNGTMATADQPILRDVLFCKHV